MTHEEAARTILAAAERFIMPSPPAWTPQPGVGGCGYGDDERGRRRVAAIHEVSRCLVKLTTGQVSEGARDEVVLRARVLLKCLDEKHAGPGPAMECLREALKRLDDGDEMKG